jgi:rhodanese-related sulfurtransferase
MEERLRHYENKLAFETDSWDLKVALEAGENIVVVDARSPQAYQKEHIPGAINIPHRNMSQETTMQIDKAALVVTYCDGIGCNASTKGALNMTKLGFRVKELMGGLDWWSRDGYETEGSAASTKRKRAATSEHRRITRRSTGRAKAARR